MTPASPPPNDGGDGGTDAAAAPADANATSGASANTSPGTPPFSSSTAAMGSSMAALLMAEAQTPPRRLNLSDAAAASAGGGAAAAPAAPTASASGGAGGAAALPVVPAVAAAATGAHHHPTAATSDGTELSVAGDVIRSFLPPPQQQHRQQGQERGGAGGARLPSPLPCCLSGFIVEAAEEEKKSDNDSGGDEEAKKNDARSCTDGWSGSNPAAAATTGVETTLLRAISDEVRQLMGAHFAEMKEQNHRDMERILAALQQENKRFHSQMLLQSEAMVAMELKLLRLEAKLVDGREIAMSADHQRGETQQSSENVSSSSAGRHHQPNPSLHAHHSYHPRGASASSWRAAGPATPVSRHLAGAAGHAVEQSRGHYHQRGIGREDHASSGSAEDEQGNNGITAVITTHHHSGASLASGVTSVEDERSLEGGHSHDEDDHVEAERMVGGSGDEDGGNDVDDDDETPHLSLNDTDSTPTVGSRLPLPARGLVMSGNLESILLNPMVGETPGNLSTRAVRGEADSHGEEDGSSWATRLSVATGSTLASTVITSATRGGSESLHVRRINPAAGEAESQDGGGAGASSSMTYSSNPHHFQQRSRSGGAGSSHTRPPTTVFEEGSRSQSPLTVQDYTTVASNDGRISLASAPSLGTSVLSNVAVASARRTRPLQNRVVSFTPDIVNEIDSTDEVTTMMTSSVVMGQEEEEDAEHHGDLLQREQRREEAGEEGEDVATANDSITMPDELDNMSTSADAIAVDSLVTSVRLWREEYEARLDALQKRWSTSNKNSNHNNNNQED